MREFIIQSNAKVDDGIGGHNREWVTFKRVKGYIDMLSGTDINNNQPAISEDSTHILIIPKFASGITDKMRVIYNNKFYSITYNDNPMELDHHNEIYLKYGGVADGV